MSNQSNKILIVDDEPGFCQVTSRILEKAGFVPLLAQDAKTALQTIRSDDPEVVIVDMNLPDLDGLELLRRVKGLDEDLPVVIITGQPDYPGAVEAMRATAHDYLQKPFQECDFIRIVRSALTERRFKLELRKLSHRTNTNHGLTEIMGPSEAIGKLIAEINRVSKSNFSVVILGETGSGKEVIARAIHQVSPRANYPFIPVDCGAIPETLLEGELFGHERGAFTGAMIARRGKFELAQKGTLFLDEILNMPIGSQAKLLRALQEKVIYRLGSATAVPIDVRVLAAASQDLETSTAAGAFRLDLYFRLNEFTLRIPPLRDRQEDIVYLAKRFLDLTNRELNKAVKGFARPALNALLRYPWPGNVRQLRSTIRRAVLLADEEVTEEHLDIDHAANGTFFAAGLNSKMQAMSNHPPSLKDIVAQRVEAVEREALVQILHQTEGNKAEAARLFRIDYKTMQSKLKKYALQFNTDTTQASQTPPL
jgi:two-component system nitrogen regulation response regulator GlnG